MKSIYAVKNNSGKIVDMTSNLKIREAQHRFFNSDIKTILVLEKVNDKDSKEREKFWIYKKIKEGEPLTNKENKKRTQKWKHNFEKIEYRRTTKEFLITIRVSEKWENYSIDERGTND